MKIEIEVEAEFFEFTSFEQWCNKAKGWFQGIRLDRTYDGSNSICVDTKGRVCDKGSEFQRAHDEGTFPVKVYQTRLTDFERHELLEKAKKATP